MHSTVQHSTSIMMMDVGRMMPSRRRALSCTVAIRDAHLRRQRHSRSRASGGEDALGREEAAC